MEPIPETVEAIEEYGPFGLGDADLLGRLREASVRVRDVVPDCLGFSLASREHGLTFTLVADDTDMAVLDAVQYLAGGPCVAAVEEQRHHPVGFDHDDLLDEESWRLFGHATAAKGVRSTLTLPLLEDQEVVGSVNLYGASAQAFTGHHEALAVIFDAWAPGAVTNADLSFATLREARQAPRLLREETTVQVAVGIIVAREGIDARAAEGRLRHAAERAGIPVHDLAQAVLDAQGLDSDDR
jgi:GAF domain-containing protein